MAAGERVLLPAVRRARSRHLIVTGGFSCREQIEQGTDRTVLHPAQVLARWRLDRRRRAGPAIRATERLTRCDDARARRAGRCGARAGRRLRSGRGPDRGPDRRAASARRIDGAHFTGDRRLRGGRPSAGSTSTARDYRRIDVDEQVEVAVARRRHHPGRPRDGRDRRSTPTSCSAARRLDASAATSLAGRVRPTLEVVVTETPAELRRRHDPATGLALIDLDRSAGRAPREPNGGSRWPEPPLTS